MTKRTLTQILSEPLGGTKDAVIDIHAGTGNLTVDRLGDEEPSLASGTLEYMEGQTPPTPSVSARDGGITLRLKAEGGRRPSLRMPWSACNAETNWQIHVNPSVTSEVIAHTGGGNVNLDLAGTSIRRISADTGGGNVDVVLPASSVDMHVAVKSGAGNVSVEVPGGMAAKIHARTGLGKLIVDPRFGAVDQNAFESPDYGQATGRVEITANSGAGNVTIRTKSDIVGIVDHSK